LSELQTQLRQMTASVNLILGLGGGWDASQLPQIHEVSRSPKKEAKLPVPPEADRVAPPNPPPVK
ncbi:MAG TPA: hypothetical protein VH640_25370, partial [Bryobacteraceae bacterium]